MKDFPNVDSFAAHAKMPVSTVSSFENNQSKKGKKGSPSVKTIEKFIKHLPGGCTLAEFFSEERTREYRVPNHPPKHLTEAQDRYADMLVEIMSATPVETNPGDENLIAALDSTLKLFVRDARQYHETVSRSGPIKNFPEKIADHKPAPRREKRGVTG